MEPRHLIALPSYIDPEAWQAFLEVRAKLRAPNTDYAQKLLLYQMQRLKDAGNDPDEVLRASIVGGWKDLYAKKREASGALPTWKPEPTNATPPPDGWAQKAKANIRRVA